MEGKRSIKFPKEKPEESLGFMFWQASNLWQRRMSNALRPLRLTLVQFVLLAGIAWLERSGETITQIRLAHHAKTDVMMTSQVLRTMETKGFIVRKPDESDTRANALALTPLGEEQIAKAIGIVQGVEHDFFALLARRYVDFLGALGRLVEANELKEVK